MKSALVLLLSALVVTSATAQTSDLTLKLSADATYNAGEFATLRATVTNLGPDAASTAGVRLTKPAAGVFSNAAAFGCIEFSDSILCNTPAIAAGASHDFIVPFVPPSDAGQIQLNARTESFTLDPNHDNDAATVAINVVKLADLSIEASVYPSLRVGQTSTLFVTIRQHAALKPDQVTFVATFPEPLVVDDSNSDCTNVDSTTIRCTIRTFGSDIATRFDVTPTHDAAPVPVTIAVQSDNDWNPANNRVSLSLPIYNIPDLDIRIASPDVLDDSNRTVATYTFTNPTDLPAANVEAEIITAPGNPDAVLPGDWACTPSATYRLKCDTPMIAPHSTSTLPVRVQFDRKYIRGTFATNVTQKPAADAVIPAQSLFADRVFYKPFTVTTLEDDGAGSLRQTIRDANAECTTSDGNPPCKIVFAVAGTIAPQTPLPVVTVTDFAIDGKSVITLDGSAAGSADGLSLFNEAAVVRGLTIHNFAKNGILSTTNINPFQSRHHVIDHNDLSGNGLRGLMASAFEGEITANTMQGNTRSAIFLTDRSEAMIRDNDISGNAASGIYIGPQSSALIEDNAIAGEREFGIAIDRGATAQIFANAIASSEGPGIDIGLDGPTLTSTPVITSARFESGVTIIEGTIPIVNRPYRVTETAYIYANATDAPRGETFLGSAQADKSGRFTLQYKGDLTGKFIDASAYIVTDFGDFISRTSTEFGNRVQVER